MQAIEFIDRETGTLIQEKPPGEGFLRFLYHHPFGELSLQLLVKRKLLSTLYGRLMSSANSKNRIAPFVEQYQINMNEAVKSVEEFTSFNDFFYRKLRSEARPMGEGLVSPADGKILAFENVAALSNFFVKGNRFTLEAFLKDKTLAQKYSSAALILVRLAPNDYHRFHFPVDGKATASHQISGWYYSVSPYAIRPNFARVFCENKRSYTILSTAEKGDILLSPVGATMVGSIIDTYKPDSAVQKGDEMGYFAFGGSSILMLVDREKVKIDQDLLENTNNGYETSIIMGEQIGT